jgi:hypothetical protein
MRANTDRITIIDRAEDDIAVRGKGPRLHWDKVLNLPYVQTDKGRVYQPSGEPMVTDRGNVPRCVPMYR